MTYPFWRNIEASPDKAALTLEVLQQAYEDLSAQGQVEPLHLLRGDVCDVCGPRWAWQVDHGLRHLK